MLEKPEISQENKVFEAWSEIEQALNIVIEKSPDIKEKIEELKEKFHPDNIDPLKKGLAGEAIQGELFCFQKYLKRKERKIIKELLKQEDLFENYSIHLSNL